MKRHSLKLALLWSALLGAALAAPATAQNTVTTGSICAVIVDNTGTRIEIANVGTTRQVICHGVPVLCEEVFSACTGVNQFLGGFADIDGFRQFAHNLQLSPSGGPFNLCKPFFQVRNANGSITTTFIVPQPILDPLTGAPVFDLDDILGNGTNVSLDPGTLVTVVLDQKPTTGKCVGVRTTIQHRSGTCKLWKVRKFYNTCSSNVTLTRIQEFERPCNDAKFAAQAGPGKKLIAVASDVLGNYITLASTGNTGGKTLAGWLTGSPVNFLFFCQDVPIQTAPMFIAEPFGFMVVSIDFRPGGVTLKPVTKPGSEKFVEFHIDVE
jgi:hypothetical protein